MSKENLIITGNDIASVIRSANSIIQILSNKIIKLENKLANTQGESNKVENNVVRVITDKESTYIEVTTGNGKYQTQLTRKE